ncbi:protein piccolo [Podospora conica]|nr:protein piccolo [Schizothecium conicum]
MAMYQSVSTDADDHVESESRRPYPYPNTSTHPRPRPSSIPTPATATSQSEPSTLRGPSHAPRTLTSVTVTAPGSSPLRAVPVPAPTPPSIPLRTSTTTESEPEIYGPDRLFGPQQAQALRSYSFARPEPVIVEGPLRRVPDLPVSPEHAYRQPQWEPGFNAAMLTDFRDELARLEGVITPGVDDTPHIQYAIEALTRHRDRDTGYSADGASSSDDEPRIPIVHDEMAEYYQPRPPRLSPVAQLHRGYSPVPREELPPQQTDYPSQPMPNPVFSAPYLAPPAPAQLQPEDEDLLPPRTDLLADPRTSADSLALSVRKSQGVVQPHEWKAIDRDYIVAQIGEQKAKGLPTLDFKPTALRTPALVTLMVLCLLMVGAIIASAVYSELHDGLLPYVSLYGGQYFLFRVLPPLLGACLLLYAQFVITTIVRILPFVQLASENPKDREGALFQGLHYHCFLWPELVGTWHTWVPMFVTWLLNFTIPLHNSLFTVILVDGQWIWSATQGVAWTLVALYLAMFLSTAVIWRHWATQRNTGLMWDPRSLADITAIISDTNTADDYAGTELARTRDGIRFALRRRAHDRLGYWTWKDARPGFWYTLGSPLDDPNTHPLNAHAQLTGATPMVAATKKPAATVAFGPETLIPDLESAVPVQRKTYLPFPLRTLPLSLSLALLSIFVLAIYLLTFLPPTSLLSNNGFPTGAGLTAAPSRPGAFSPANFLWSFLPSLLGMILYLAFQSLDMHVRVLAPWAALAADGGATPERGLLADWAACAPGAVSVRAARAGEWRVAAVSFLGGVFVLVPVLAGGSFMALTVVGTGEVRMFPSWGVYGACLGLVVVYVVAVAGVLGVGRRGMEGLAHGVGCVGEVVGFLGNEEMLGERGFKVRKGREGVVEGVVAGGRWELGGGGEGGRFGVRRVRRFTEGVRKSRISRGRVGGFGV